MSGTWTGISRTGVVLNRSRARKAGSSPATTKSMTTGGRAPGPRRRSLLPPNTADSRRVKTSWRGGAQGGQASALSLWGRGAAGTFPWGKHGAPRASRTAQNPCAACRGFATAHLALRYVVLYEQRKTDGQQVLGQAAEDGVGGRQHEGRSRRMRVGRGAATAIPLSAFSAFSSSAAAAIGPLCCLVVP